MGGLLALAIAFACHLQPRSVTYSHRQTLAL
jgi:hypothetical protein